MRRSVPIGMPIGLVDLKNMHLAQIKQTTSLNTSVSVDNLEKA